MNEPNHHSSHTPTPPPPTAQKPQQEGDVWTIQKILEWTTGFLKEKECESPRLEAEVLLAFACGCERIQLYTRYHEPLTDATRARMRELVQRRAKSEPVAYLVGFREFFSLDFKVTPDVLIPRPETETLVLELIEEARTKNDVRILDLCTGTGCIAIAAAVNLKTVQLVAVDVSEAALEIATENATTHNVIERIDFRKGDLWEPLSEDSPSDDEKKFDIIASNPPYITSAEIETLIPDVREHEPRLALDGGTDGLDFVRRLLEKLPLFLKPNGMFLCEISPEQAAEVLSLVEKTGFFRNATVLDDSDGRQRLLQCWLNTN